MSEPMIVWYQCEACNREFAVKVVAFDLEEPACPECRLDNCLEIQPPTALKER